MRHGSTKWTLSRLTRRCFCQNRCIYNFFQHVYELELVLCRMPRMLNSAIKLRKGEKLVVVVASARYPDKVEEK